MSSATTVESSSYFQKSRVQQKMKHSRIIMSLREVLGITHLELEIEANSKSKATPHQAFDMHFPFSLLSFLWCFISLSLLYPKLFNPKYQLCFFGDFLFAAKVVIIQKKI